MIEKSYLLYAIIALSTLLVLLIVDVIFSRENPNKKSRPTEVNDMQPSEQAKITCKYCNADFIPTKGKPAQCTNCYRYVVEEKEKESQPRELPVEKLSKKLANAHYTYRGVLYDEVIDEHGEKKKIWKDGRGEVIAIDQLDPIPVDFFKFIGYLDIVLCAIAAFVILLDIASVPTASSLVMFGAIIVGLITGLAFIYIGRMAERINYLLAKSKKEDGQLTAKPTN